MTDTREHRPHEPDSGGELMPPAPDESVRVVIRGDRGARIPVHQESALRLDANIVVSAGAGSGKTSLLIDRLIALIRSGVPVDQLVAITFTKKAAGELQERFFSGLLAMKESLEKRPNDDSSAWAKELASVEDAVERNEEAFIGTIHSFCARILRMYSGAAGLPADFQQIEGADELLDRLRFWQSSLASLSGDSHLKILREAEVPDSALYQLFSTSVDTDGVLMQPSEVARPDLESVFEAVSETLRKVAPLIPASLNPDPFTLAVQRSLLLIESGREWSDADRNALLTLVASCLTKDDPPRFDIKVRRWGKKATPSGTLAYELRDGEDDFAEGRSFIDLIRSDVIPLLEARQHWLHDRALGFIVPLVQEYARTRVAEGRITYDDLLREAGRVVRTSVAVRSALQARFTRILVDEFQDTDPEQAALLFGLSAKSVNQDDWRADDLLAGRLFVVGDDKQSIYRFRKADFQAFRTVRNAIAAQGGMDLRLTANFRSDERICQWVNESVGPLFGKESAPYQADWEDLQAGKGQFSSDPAVLRIAVDKQVRGQSDMPRSVAEAKAIARLILEDNTPRFGDWLILVRNHTRVPVLMRVLVDAGIPVALEGGKGDRVSETLAQVHDLLRCLTNPSDHVALVSVLTGIWFGISDAELMRYRQAGGGWHQWMKDAPLLSDVSEKVIDASRILSGWAEKAHDVPPSSFFEVLLAESGVAGALRQRIDGDVAVGMLELIGEYLAQMQHQGKTLPECVRELGRYRSGELEAELFSDNVPFGDSVRIMTVHGSKGLQAPRVILADVTTQKEREPERHVWRDGPVLRGLTPVRSESGRFGKKLLEPAGWKEAVVEEKRYDAAENVRLVYVAATRAKEQLIVCTHATEGKGMWDTLIPPLESIHAQVIDATPTEEDLVPGFGLRRVSLAESDGWEDPSGRIAELAVSTWRVRRPSDHDEEHAAGVSSPSSVPQDGSHVVQAPSNRAGKRFGSAMHTLFEALAAYRKTSVTDEIIDSLVDDVFRYDEGDVVGDEGDIGARAKSHLRRFVSSGLWESLQAAERVLTEVPFTTVSKVDGEEVLSSGIVDLAFKTGEEWTIVDYKTDRTNRENILERHASQVTDYVAAWHGLFDSARVHGIIWSTALDSAINVLSSEELERGEA